MALHALDYAVFCVGTSSSLALGLYYSLRKSKRRGCQSNRNYINSATLGRQQEEVFLGSHSLPGWSLAPSLLASLASGVGVVSVPAHQYAYGFNFAWHIAAMALTTPCVVYFFLPVLYRLKVTSVFQYLRLRFGNGVGITACVIYFFFSQTLGAVSIYSAAVGMSTMLGAPLLACNVLIGALGTTYTALGGLRGVVWADCVQGFVLFVAPFVIIAKIAYDSARLGTPLRPLTDISSEYYLRLDPDVTSDETMWANAVASIPFHLVREGMDQMVVQRFLAAKSFKTARRVVWAGTAMVCFFCLAITLAGVALAYWYRDCDPMLTGAVTRYDQMVPLYVAESLSSAAGLRGLFLAGLVGASISTVSSVINSHAATFYVDIVSPYFELRDKKAAVVTHSLEFGSGALMTAFAVAVPYMGTATRLLMALYSGASGPFAGMVVVAICLPWINTRGTAMATSAVFALELWQTVGRTLSGLQPPTMPTTLLRCFQNFSGVPDTFGVIGTSQQPEGVTNGSWFGREISLGSADNDIFPLYLLSSYWTSFIAMFATVFFSILLSVMLDGKRELHRNLPLSSPSFLRLWTRLGLLPEKLKEPINNGSGEFEEDCDEDWLPSILHLTDPPLSQAGKGAIS